MIRLKLKNKNYNILLLNYWFNPKFKLTCKLRKKKKWNSLKYQKIILKKNTFKRFKLIKTLKNLYKERLKTKQIIKKLYGNITEKQFLNLFKKNITFLNLIINLECKINIILFRSNLTKSIIQANKLISQGYVYLNNSCIKNINYTLKVGDILQLKFKKSPISIIEKNTVTLNYIEINNKLNKIILIKTPKFKQIPFLMKLNFYLFSEFYKN
jgi:small subunit ribosomal protein S4